MSVNEAVEELVNQKKLELGAANKSAKPTTLKETFLDNSAFPVLKNKISYEEIVGEPHPDGLDRWYPKSTHVWEHTDDIPEPNPNWVPDHYALPMIISGITHGHNMLIVGPPGTGKTTDVREINARIGKPYYRFSGMEGLEPADLLGQNQLRAGETKFVDGAIMRAVRCGGCWAYDEPFKSPPGTNMAVQWLAEPAKQDRSVMLYGHEDESKIKVPAHPEFQMILCDNARGTGDNMDLYAATNVQDVSFVNRMQYKVRKDYLPEDAERSAVMKSYPWILEPLARQMVQVARIMRKAWKQGSVEMPFTFRELETWSEVIAETGGDIKLALEVSYGNMLEVGDEADILQKAIGDVGID